MRTFAWAISAAVSFALAACGGNTLNTPGTTGGGTTGGTGSGTTTGTPVDYPVPTPPQVYGIAQGNTFPLVSLQGGALMNLSTTSTPDCPPNDKCTTSSSNFMPSFTFQDLYNAGKPAPAGQGIRYAFIDISGAWCPHCVQEAKDLPGTIPAYGAGYVKDWLAEGGIVFSILVQNYQEDGPATTQNLFTWVNSYQLNYSISIDMEQNMVYTTGIRAWPGNVIVRLHDMQVIYSVLGAGSSFYQDYSKYLTACENNPNLPNDCYPNSTCDPSTLTCVPNN